MTTAGGVSSRGVLAFADRLDVLLVALGTLDAVADGCSYNLLLVFASDVEKVRSLVVLGAYHHRSICARLIHSFNSLFFFWMQSCLNFVYLALAVLPVAFLGKLQPEDARDEHFILICTMFQNSCDRVLACFR